MMKEHDETDSESKEKEELEGEDEDDVVDRADDRNDAAKLFDEEVFNTLKLKRILTLYRCQWW